WSGRARPATFMPARKPPLPRPLCRTRWQWGRPARIGAGEMVLDRPNDIFDDFAVGAVAAFHVDVGFGISLPLALREPSERVLGIAILEQWTGVAPRRPFGEDVDRRV